MLNKATWQIDFEFQQFIQPVRNPQLTAFCTELTSISQKDVELAPKFPQVMSHLQKWLESFPNYVFCSWGEYDKKQFLQDCKHHNVPYPFGSEHRNIKKEFSEYLGVSKGFGMAQALQKLGLELKGTHHRGIDGTACASRISIDYGKYLKKISRIGGTPWRQGTNENFYSPSLSSQSGLQFSSIQLRTEVLTTRAYLREN